MTTVDDVRAFNRFYTRIAGLLDAGLVGTAFSLTEARVLYELAQDDVVEVAGLRRTLDLDAGYLSRILGRLEADGLVVREQAPSDGRRQLARLTEAGRGAFAELDAWQVEAVRDLLAPLPPAARERLVGGMADVRRALGDTTGSAGLVLRAPGPGDLGWVVARHGALYAAEYGWDATFEGLVARIVADGAAGTDARRNAGWIAELDGAPVGCVFCVAGEGDTAVLRLLLVEPSARGHGVGARLVEECLRFARRAGYRRITLWTNDVLVAARRLYERAGFRLDAHEPHRSFGQDLVGETWSREL